MFKKEIERIYKIKYKIKYLKEIKGNVQEVLLVEQGYLITTISTEVRIRKLTQIYSSGETKYFGEVPSVYNLTIKQGLGLVRDEIEIPITEDTYHTLLQELQAPPISKLRYVLADSPYIPKSATLDIYIDPRFYFEEGPLMILEIEFDSQDEAFAFDLEIEGAEGVTNNDDYRCKNLWNKFCLS